MKKLFLVILVIFASASLFAGGGLFIDYLAAKPANTTQYLGTFGLSLFYEEPNIASVSNLSLRPTLTCGLGSGIVERSVSESDVIYALLIPDISLLYYIRNSNEQYDNGASFYVGAGALMNFKIEQYNDDAFTDKITYSYPYPTLKFGLEVKRNLLLEINISSPVMISLGFRF